MSQRAKVGIWRPEHGRPHNLIPTTLSTRIDYNDRTQPMNAHIRLGVDLGTSTLGISYQMVNLKKEGVRSEIFDIMSVEESECIPMIIAYSENKLFEWGVDVINNFRNGRISEEKVLRLFKLALYPDAATASLREEVLTKLKRIGKTIEELMRECLKALVEYAINKIRVSPFCNACVIENLPIEMYLSVPKMWPPGACYVMSHAAESSGVAKCQLVSEPECAASYILKKRLSSPSSSTETLLSYLKKGDVVLVADIGGGTGDFVSYRLLSSPEEEAEHVRLEEVGQPAGFLCGSEFINREFIQWLRLWKDRSANGPLKRIAESMGLTVDGYLTAASWAFDVEKAKFPSLPHYNITVPRGSRGSPDATEISKARMETFFLPIVDNAIDAIETLIHADTTAILLPGGFGKCKFFVNELKMIFEHQQETVYRTIDPSSKRILHQARKVPINPIKVLEFPGGLASPVAQGALYRYQDVDIQGIRSQYSIGISRTEEYDKDIHKDALAIPATVRKTKRDMDEYLFKKRNYIKPDPIDDELDIVEDRWQPLLKKGERNDSRVTRASRNSWLIQYPPVDQVVEFVQDIYFTKLDIQPHDPVMNNDGTPRKGIFYLTTVTKLFNPKEYDVNWESHSASNGTLVHEVWCRMILRTDGPNIKFGWQIVTDGSQPYDKSGVENEKMASVITWEETDMDQLLSENFSFDVRD